MSQAFAFYNSVTENVRDEVKRISQGPYDNGLLICVFFKRVYLPLFDIITDGFNALGQAFLPTVDDLGGVPYARPHR